MTHLENGYRVLNLDPSYSEANTRGSQIVEDDNGKKHNVSLNKDAHSNLCFVPHGYNNKHKPRANEALIAGIKSAIDRGQQVVLMDFVSGFGTTITKGLRDSLSTEDYAKYTKHLVLYVGWESSAKVFELKPSFFSLDDANQLREQQLCGQQSRYLYQAEKKGRGDLLDSGKNVKLTDDEKDFLETFTIMHEQRPNAQGNFQFIPPKRDLTPQVMEQSLNSQAMLTNNRNSFQNRRRIGGSATLVTATGAAEVIAAQQLAAGVTTASTNTTASFILSAGPIFGGILAIGFGTAVASTVFFKQCVDSTASWKHAATFGAGAGLTASGGTIMSVVASSLGSTAAFKSAALAGMAYPPLGIGLLICGALLMGAALIVSAYKKHQKTKSNASQENETQEQDLPQRPRI